MLFCLIISLFKHKTMNGGEYLKMRPINATNDARDITLSISQLTIENNSTLIIKALKNHIDVNLLFSSIVNKAAYDFGKRALEVIGKEQYTFISASSKQTYLYLQKHISDACLDLFGIAVQGLINKGFACNECDDNGNIEKGGLYSIYDEKIEGINMNGNLWFKHIYKTFTPTAEPIKYNVFIEFVYDSITIKDRAYVNIHMSTNAILNQIINTKKKTHLYIFRYYVDENGYVRTQSKITIENGITIVDNAREYFDKIIIPSTKGQFKRDEGLFFTRNGERYNVQIEHSEGLGAHKSNIVDFVVRNLDNKDQIKQTLKTLGYKTKGTGENERFIWYAKDWPWITDKNNLPTMNEEETVQLEKSNDIVEFNKWSLDQRTLYKNFRDNKDILANSPII